jgi:hypothetical protein
MVPRKKSFHPGSGKYFIELQCPTTISLLNSSNNFNDLLQIKVYNK